MILILSSDGDLSCDLVQNWLHYYDYPYIRINTFDFIRKRLRVEIAGTRMSFTIDDREIPLDSINAIWYRKYGFFRCSDTYRKLCDTKKFSEDIINHITKEFIKVIDFFEYALKDRNWLTNPSHSNLNKMEVLYQASKCGLEVADSFIVNTKSDLKELSGKVISKSILDPIIPSWGDKHKCMMYTTVVKDNLMNGIPERFMPSLVQTLIPKEYELRIFYICGKLYPMAIFSQRDKQTKLDFRNYNWEKPNRFVPCQLEPGVSAKIRKLMKALGLNCGSIDMIKGTDGKLYFLEVNPTGQFGMVDFPCNYGLHRIVAEELIKMDGKKRIRKWEKDSINSSARTFQVNLA